MAKKARRRLEDAEKAEAFQFPEFDERSFLLHEYEQSIATAVAAVLALLLALMSWAIDHQPVVPPPVPWVLGLAGVVAAPYLVRGIRPLAGEYTRGDWVWLILTVLLGWLGLWFLFLNLFPV